MRPGEYARALFGPEKPAVSVEVEVESGEQEVSDSEIAVSAAIMAALESRDAKKLAQALRSHHVSMCAMDASSEPMDED